jgi:signal transduction histidine kinase
MLRNLATYSAIALENADSFHHLAVLLDELRAAQDRLVTQSKLAALGELTAGIAHEIQNPLNFVNNFSEISSELLQELKEELANGNQEESQSLLESIGLNLDKINYHGKRADSIVKGMLLHSRGTSGQKQLTDINNLCDEFFRLAFHGLRAKDKSFNASMKTDFDESLEKANVVPQNIGQVVLNLISNAFYAVTERKKMNHPDYEPTVWVSTKKVDGKIQIRVKDNGIGIPKQVLDKIFQPFFTTKPTGEGTGLGLSLAYDIVTKEHGGELLVETKENEGTTFIVQLPTF